MTCLPFIVREISHAAHLSRADIKLEQCLSENEILIYS